MYVHSAELPEVFFLREDRDELTGGIKVDLTKEEIEFITKAEQDWEKAQDILIRAYDKSESEK